MSAVTRILCIYINLILALTSKASFVWQCIIGVFSCTKTGGHLQFWLPSGLVPCVWNPRIIHMSLNPPRAFF